MRAALRLLTPRNPAFTPTGVTGVLTHPHPRPTLLAVYSETLRVLSQIPAHSVYRQSAENLTKHRLAVIEATKPPGFDKYAAAFGEKPKDIKDVGMWMREVLWDFLSHTPDAGNKAWIEHQMRRWGTVSLPEGPHTPAASKTAKQLPGQTQDQATAVPEGTKVDDLVYDIALEPQMTAEQVAEVEDKIKDGLIEDIIESGWNELECAKAMIETKAWEPLEVVPEKGQWEGFERTPKGVGAQD